MTNWQKEEEKKRYGDLLEKARQHKEQEEKAMLEAINNVIKCGQEAEKERDSDWERKQAWRDELIDKTKEKMKNKSYKL